MGLAKKIFYYTAELLGLLLFLLQFLIYLLRGFKIEDSTFNLALRTLTLTKFFRSLVPFFLYGVLLLFLVSVFVIAKLIRGKEDRIVPRIIARVLQGFVLVEIVAYVIANRIYFRGGFVSFQFALGILLLFAITLHMLSDKEFLDLLFYIRYDRAKINAVARLAGRSLKYFGLLFLSLMLIVPTLIPLSGLLAQPPNTPQEYGTPGPYDVSMIRLNHEVPDNISQYLIPDNKNSSWYIYVTVPKDTNQENIPIALFLHGFRGSDFDNYDTLLHSISSYGIIGVFVQYVTYVDLSGPWSEPENTDFRSSNAMYMRYLMEWSGIVQAVNALQEATLFSSVFQANTNVDMSRVMITGHSLGGGMTPYIATKVAQQGWGGNEMLLDMEAPWYVTSNPLIDMNYSLIPDHTTTNILGYDDDHTVSPCIGMQQYEEIRENVVDDSDLSYLIIHSDRYGYPRLVATHYVPTDPARDPLTDWGVYKRVNAMASYLFEVANNISPTNQETYFVGGNAVMVSMGKWSDGRDVLPMTYTQDPFGLRGGIDLAEGFIEAHSYGRDVCV